MIIVGKRGIMQLFYAFVIMLFLFSILGWDMEVTLKFMQNHYSSAILA